MAGHLHPGRDPEDYIHKLGQALGDNVQHPLFIETQVGRGYCFIAPVTEEVAAAPDLTAARVARTVFGRQAEWQQLDAWDKKALRRMK